MKKWFIGFVITCLSLAAANAQITYKDVAPIFYNKCTTCHHTGSVAPMSLLNYSETSAYSSFIKKYIMAGIMPPWPPDTTYHKFVGQRTLTVLERNLIVAWIDSGANKGDTALAPMAPMYNNSYQLSGTPDLIVKIPAFTSNAAANDAYNCFVVPTGLMQDRIVRAYEVVAGDHEIVHHALVAMDTSGNAVSDLSGGCYTMPGSDVVLGGYAPGCSPTVYPSKAPLKIGFRLKAHSNLVFEIHYSAGSAGQVDSTSIRIFFYPVGTTGVREIYTKTILENTDIRIPANSVQSIPVFNPKNGGIRSDLSLYAVFPHQHNVGVSLVNYAFGNIDTIPLIRINKWNFRWQGFYTYPQLVRVPAGYVFYASHTYNNTTSNPNNPFNPPQNIVYGHSTTNEMLADAYQYINYNPGDDTINIASLIAGDTLLGVQELPVFTITTKAYPNPFNNDVHIGYTLSAASDNVSIVIYNMFGSRVKTITPRQRVAAPGYYESVWDGKGDNGNALAQGVYIYTVTANKSSTSGRLVLMK